MNKPYEDPDEVNEDAMELLDTLIWEAVNENKIGQLVVHTPTGVARIIIAPDVIGCTDPNCPHCKGGGHHPQTKPGRN